MLPAARILLPVSASVLVVIYKYFRSGQKSKFSEGVEVPLNPTSVPSPAPSDLDILDWIRRLDPAVLDWIRNLNPDVLHEIQSDPAYLDEIWNFNPSIVDETRRLDLKEKEEKEEEKRRECEKENEKERERESSGGGGRNENGGEVEKKVVEESSRSNQYPLRPEAGDCPYYLKTGNCKFGSNCKKRECEKENEKERERESSGGGGQNENGGEVEKKVVEESSIRNQYPLRPEAGDCSYYLKNGNCKFGSNCKFNHPRRRKNKQVSKDKAKQREELEEKQDQTKSKYYVRPGRRIGVPSVAPALELNFSGLPIRPGEKNCPYYMRTGTCEYETNCKFNHPDPTAARESRPQSAYGNGRPASLQGLPNSQGINSETTEWNGYQAPAYLPHRSMRAPPPYVMNNSVTETNYYGQYAQQMQAEELPERPGQPVCFYFAQTGDCIDKSNCQNHHPKNQTAATPSCALNDRGLPLRPGQNICTQYSRSGLCSSGPTCRFDHPSLSGSFL